MGIPMLKVFRQQVGKFDFEPQPLGPRQVDHLPLAHVLPLKSLLYDLIVKRALHHKLFVLRQIS